MCGGALANGVTREEMQEVFLQACIYCGVPAAGEAFRVAREVFEAGAGGGADAQT